MVKDFQPDAIVNAAAYTAVDSPKASAPKPLPSDAAAVASLAAAARAVHAKFIHISTDYVFDGSSKVPYTVPAPPAPPKRLRPIQARRRIAGAGRQPRQRDCAQRLDIPANTAAIS